MSDPLAFRNDYCTASRVVARRVSASPFGDSWQASVLDGAGDQLGAPVHARAVGPWGDAIGAVLLDLEVVASAWADDGNGVFTAPAKSLRA